MVAPTLVDFMTAHPALQADLVLTDSIVDLVGEGLDFGIRIATLNVSSLVARRVDSSPRALFATPGYLLTGYGTIPMTVKAMRGGHVHDEARRRRRDPRRRRTGRNTSLRARSPAGSPPSRGASATSSASPSAG
ncbi:LysR substrate-binding domain-containing protein [Methylobacterium frigidaeris]|uniref:LysR substrate-binding domain-containing protein n=1 Tax=Methylobacterium frigidaeris TaxID=2038277 RepID=UPI001EDCDB8B